MEDTMTKREWIQYPKDIQINTDLGPVFLNVVQGDYVYVDASGNGKSVTFKEKMYAISVRLHTKDGGKTWEVGDVYARKYASFSIHDDVPPTFKARIVAEIVSKVSAYLATHPTLLLDAAVADSNNSLLSEEAKLAELREQAEAQRKKVDQLHEKLERAAVARHKFGR